MDGERVDLALTASSVEYRYRLSPTPTLLQLSATFEPGLTVLLGPNGAGKTTLLKIIAGLLKPQSGEIHLNTHGQSFASSSRKYRGSLGYLPQFPAFIPGFTALDHLVYCGWLAGASESVSRKQAQEWLGRVDLTSKANAKCSSLSGGMAKRLAIAAAAIDDPQVLLLDEPSAGLDPAQRSQFRETLVALKTDKVVLSSTHLVDDLFGTVDRVAVVARGRIAFHGTLAEFLAESHGQRGDLTRQAESAYSSIVGATER